MVKAHRSYMIQKHKLYLEPFAGVGKIINIVHLAGLFWPKPTNQRRGMSGERESHAIRTL
jgi:hypothetical protein